MSATINGTDVVSVRLVLPYRGVWHADIDANPEQVGLLPTSGPAVLVVGAAPGPVSTLIGVVDDLAAGSFVASTKLRIVGGKGGWGEDVPAQHFHLDAGLLSTAIYNAVAAQVLEEVADLVPTTFGPDYVLSAGPASRVFDDVLWWVDPVTGITNVGPLRPPAVPDPSLEVLDWDPIGKVAEVSCDTVILPGTPLVDVRIPESPVIIRDVEQVFDGQKSRATCFCSVNAVSPLLAAFRTMIKEFARTGFLMIRRYRVVNPGVASQTWLLQAVDRGPLGQASPMPDAIPFRAWSGHAGATSKLLPGTEVLVTFVDGDPKQPVIVSYATLALPLESTVDATIATHVAPSSPAVDIGKIAASINLGPLPVPLAHASPVTAFMAAVAVFLGGATPVSGTLSYTLQGMASGWSSLSLTDQGNFTAAVAALFGLCASLALTTPTTVVKGT